MFPRATYVFRHLNLRGTACNSTKASNTVPPKLHTPELSSLPPAPHLRSLQYKRAKRGSIKPILNYEPIKLGARVDPTHPVLKDKSFQPPTAGNEYFDTKVYPNVMLKRLGVVFMPNGKLRPREPKEPDFPILKNKKRVKFPSAVILAIKKIHKSDVVRTRLKRKILEAIKLVVTRGASVDLEGKHITFAESEAGEAKWILRDWYYMVYPKPAVYYASWPDLIRATRNTLSEAVQKGTEWASSWKIQLAEREGAAMARLARREMRRVRMWRRQEREALTRGYIAEDVGVRRKEKGTGVKKRRANREKPRPGVGRENLKILRAPSRVDFKEGHFSTRNSSVKPSLNRSPKRISKISGLETVSSQKKPHIPNVHSFPDVTSSVPALKAGAKVRTNRRPADYNRTPKTIYSSQIGDTSLSADATNTKLPSHDLDFKATHAWKSATRVGKQKK